MRASEIRWTYDDGDYDYVLHFFILETSEFACTFHYREVLTAPTPLERKDGREDNEKNRRHGLALWAYLSHLFRAVLRRAYVHKCNPRTLCGIVHYRLLHNCPVLAVRGRQHQLAIPAFHLRHGIFDIRRDCGIALSLCNHIIHPSRGERKKR